MDQDVGNQVSHMVVQYEHVVEGAKLAHRLQKRVEKSDDDRQQLFVVLGLGLDDAEAQSEYFGVVELEHQQLGLLMKD
jgi:hypothetical protein